MKHCDNCNKDFDTKEKVCPVCGNELEEAETTNEIKSDEIVTTMMLLGML